MGRARSVEDLRLDGRIILERILEISGGPSEYGNEPSGSIKGREFLD
jgi:hypothetical protein